MSISARRESARTPTSSVPVLADLPRVDVDVDDLRVARERRLVDREEQREDGRADGEDEVGRRELASECDGGDDVEEAGVERVLRGERELGAEGGVHARADRLGELHEFRLAAALADAVAAEDDGRLRLEQEAGGSLDGIGVGADPGGSAGGGDDLDLGLFVHHVRRAPRRRRGRAAAPSPP